MSGAELEIRRRIEERDRITFAEFMELALFWPDGGYYSSPDNIGPRGDFYTAPGAHPVFGALVCLQTFQMWQLIGRPESFWLVEMGAGTGLLCHDVASYSPYISRDFAEFAAIFVPRPLRVAGCRSRASRRQGGTSTADR